MSSQPVRAVLAYADGMGATVIDAIDGLSYLAPDGLRYQHPRLRYERAGRRIECLLMRLANNVTLPWASAAGSGLWDVVLLVADPGALGPDAVADDAGYLWTTRAFRKLRRLAAAHPTYLRGPWSLAHLLEAYPAKAAELLQTEVLDGEGEPTGGYVWSFPLLAGDNPAALLAVDYRPSRAEVDNDTDADPSALMGE